MMMRNIPIGYKIHIPMFSATRKEPDGAFLLLHHKKEGGRICKRTLNTEALP